MEILFEIILSVVFEDSVKGMKARNIPIWLRMLCAIFVGAIFLIAIGSIGLFSVLIWDTFFHIPSVLLFLLDFVLVVFAVKKVRNRG